jgi:hypothetical protein
LRELKNRGVRDILIACVDGLKGFPQAIEGVFPGMCQEFCVDGSFSFAPQADLGAGKAGVLVLDVHFSAAHSCAWFWSLSFHS